MSLHPREMFTGRLPALRAVGVATCWELLLLLAGQPAGAAVLFSYDPSTGQFPTDQGWLAFDVDADGPLTAANTAGTSADNANAAIETVEGMNVLHIRDTLTDSTADLPNYYYAWSAAEQQALIDNGLRFTLVAQALTNSSNNSNVRLGFNGTLFESQFDNINPDQAIQVQSFGTAALFPLDAQFHTLVIMGMASGSNFEFSYTMDGGARVALTPVTNPTPATFESTVFFGGFSSAGRTSDLLVKSVAMEAIPEPSGVLMALTAACLAAMQRRRAWSRAE